MACDVFNSIFRTIVLLLHSSSTGNCALCTTATRDIRLQNEVTW